MNKYVCERTPKPSSVSRPNLVVRQFQEEVNCGRCSNNPGGEAFKLEEGFLYIGVQTREEYVPSSSPPSSIKKATALLERWVKDSVVFLPHVDRFHIKKIRGAKYFPYHSKKEHTFEHCVVFINSLDKKLKVGEMLFQNERALHIMSILFETITTITKVIDRC